MNGRHWTTREIALLRALYPDLKAETVAREIGRPIKSVHAKAHQLGIGKSDEFKASFRSGRIQASHTDPRMIATRFKPGLVPWNKGTNYVAGGRSALTQFKPGGRPHTWVPVGSYRINLSKGLPRLEQKMSETPGPNHLRWVPVARLVWERHHGPVPAGHFVVFRETRLATTVLEDITVDKLECITRAQNAQRNHPRNKSPELARLVQLKGAITRQVNRIHREAQEKAATP